MKLNRAVKVMAIFIAVAVAASLAVAQDAPPARGGGRAPGGPGGGAQAAPGGRQGGGRGGGGPVFTVTSTGWADGDVIPSKFVYSGDKKSPPFDLKWMMGGAEVAAPATLQSYAIIFHDIENAPRGGDPDTLHWMAWDFPGTLKSIPEGLPAGDLPDGTKQSTTNIGRGSYFGPGAGPGPYHHYVFEFYALDIKLNIPATSNRTQVLAAMDGHVIGKAAYVGRYHS
jgi:Raf kinase inhibitor-like YbhB/YbcL family protein